MYDNDEHVWLYADSLVGEYVAHTPYHNVNTLRDGNKDIKISSNS